MIVNPDKFQAILIDKRKSDHTNHGIVVDNRNIKVVSSVELLGIQVDDKLCRSTANQLNVLFRLKADSRVGRPDGLMF